MDPDEELIAALSTQTALLHHQSKLHRANQHAAVKCTARQGAGYHYSVSTGWCTASTSSTAAPAGSATASTIPVAASTSARRHGDSNAEHAKKGQHTKHSCVPLSEPAACVA